MKALKKNKAGFTLIELMIVVVIIGVLAMLAIPAFLDYIKRSKTAEVPNNLQSLFQSAASYYSAENGTAVGAVAFIGGMNQAINYCTVADASSGNTPGAGKSQVDFAAASTSFGALGFAIADGIYYQYNITNSTNMCDNMASTQQYIFTALGDLDGDMTTSLFSLDVASDPNNTLFRAPTITMANELE